MKKFLDAIMVGLCVMLAFSCEDKEVPTPPYTNTNEIEWTGDENHLYDLVELYRYDYALPPLLKDDFIYQLANQRIDQLIEEHYQGEELNHDIPWLQEQIESQGLFVARENLAYGYPTTEQALQAWIESIGHVYTMLNENYIYTGIAIKVDEHGHRFYCQIFAR